MMSDKISAVNQVAAVAKGNTVGFGFFTFIANKAWLDRRFSTSAIDYLSQAFGSRLYQQLKDEPGNIIMSPFSVSGVMAMVRLIVVMTGYGKFDHQHIFMAVYRWLLGLEEKHSPRCNKACHSQGM